MNSRKYLTIVIALLFLVMAGIFLSGTWQSIAGTANGM